MEAADGLMAALLAASRVLVAMSAASIEASPVDVTLNQYRALVVLASRSPIHMVDLARELFGTSGAVLSVLDGDTSRHVVHVGLDYDTLDRANTFCNFTIQGRGALIVPDATADARFADNPYVVGDPRIRFYAGFPIEAPGGEPIGALCVFDQDPRRASQIDEVLLRRLALQVQQQLHGQLVG